VTVTTLSFKMDTPKLYRLIAADGSTVASATKGTLGGHRKNRVYGRLDCKAARRALQNGRSYEQQRVFFADEATAIAAGYRPCGVCLPDAHEQWKSSQK
jgi:hypothetical protein